jgi:site-specific recombinase XerD
LDTALAIDLWLDALEAEGRSPETLKTYRSLTKPLPSQLATLVEPSAPVAIRAYLKAYREGHSPTSLRSVFVTFQSFFNWAVREGLIPKSPMAGMRAPKMPETPRTAYSQGQLRALFTHLSGRTDAVGLRDQALVAVLLDCGLRASESCRLTLDDLVEGALFVRVSKTGRPRLAPLGKRSAQQLNRYLAHSRAKLKPTSNHLFVTAQGKPLTRFTIALLLKRHGARVGFALSAHKLRHAFATQHALLGTPTEVLRLLGGWQSYAMVRQYVHLSEAQLGALHVRASPLDHL